KEGVTVFENATMEPCLLTNPNVAGSFGLKFYAGAPLTTHDGFRIGTLCIIDKVPRLFSTEENQILEGLAQIVMDEIELRLSAISEMEKLRHSNEELAVMNEEMTSINEEMTASNEELLRTQQRLLDSNLMLTESEENLQKLADNISQLAWMTDGKGQIYWYNKRWFDYTGTNLEEMKGSGWQKVQHPDHVARVVEKYNNDIVINGEVWEDTFPLRGKDGEYRWFLSRAVPFKDSEGNIIRWFGTNTDITNERELSLQKDAFLGIISHELKTPITSLKANLQLLDIIKKEPTNSLMPKIIESSGRSMEKINSLVDDLLTMQSFTEGQLRLTKSNFKIWDMLNLCCNHVRLAGKHELIVEGDHDIAIYADEHRIDQVMVNFVNNAVKYAPDSPKIYLIFSRDKGYVKVSVKDSGPGIPKENLPHLFDRYWRASHRSGTYSGLGLGLYICTEIIHRHDGEIGVESEVGKGSTFWFTLPDTIADDVIAR
ncbi:MAG: ATP-binding protein, partial [Ginsengibacter sp.]